MTPRRPTRSVAEYEAAILAALVAEPLTMRALTGKIGAARSMVHLHTRALIAAGKVQRDKHTYRLCNAVTDGAGI